MVVVLSLSAHLQMMWFSANSFSARCSFLVRLCFSGIELWSSSVISHLILWNVSSKGLGPSLVLNGFLSLCLGLRKNLKSLFLLLCCVDF